MLQTFPNTHLVASLIHHILAISPSLDMHWLTHTYIQWFLDFLQLFFHAICGGCFWVTAKDSTVFWRKTDFNHTVKTLPFCFLNLIFGSFEYF